MGGNIVTSSNRSRPLVRAVALLAGLSAGPALAQSGLLTRPIDLPPINLSSGAPLAEAPYELESGKQYSLMIQADGSAELAVHGPDFFRNIWINEIIVNNIEIRPLGIDSLEFDAAGEAEITFVTIRPGTFLLRIPGHYGGHSGGYVQREMKPRVTKGPVAIVMLAAAMLLPTETPASVRPGALPGRADADWPCIQRKVPETVPGLRLVWSAR
jgi:hypothetical protein